MKKLLYTLIVLMFLLIVFLLITEPGPSEMYTDGIGVWYEYNNAFIAPENELYLIFSLIGLIIICLYLVNVINKRSSNLKPGTGDWPANRIGKVR